MNKDHNGIAARLLFAKFFGTGNGECGDAFLEFGEFGVIAFEGARGGERLDYILDNHVRRFLDVTQRMVKTAGDLGLIRKVPWASLFFLVFSGGPALFALGEFAKGIGARPEGMTEHEFLEQHANATADMFVAALTPPAADTSKS